MDNKIPKSTWGMIILERPLSEEFPRLKEYFTAEERAKLALAILEDIVNSLKDSWLKENILIVALEDEVIAEGERLSVCSIKFMGEKNDLTGSYTMGINWLKSKKQAKAVLFIPNDLPLIRGGDINRLLNFAGCENGPRVVIFSPTRGGGVSAIYSRPSDLFTPTFANPALKELSYAKHVEQIQSRNHYYREFDSFRFSVDIDVPADLVEVLIHGVSTKTFFKLLSFPIVFYPDPTNNRKYVIERTKG